MKRNDKHILLKEFGSNSLSYLTLSDDLSYFKGDWKGYIAYKELFQTAVVLGDPIVSDNELSIAIRDFKKCPFL